MLHEPEFRVDRLPRRDHVAAFTKLVGREFVCSELLPKLVE